MQLDQDFPGNIQHDIRTNVTRKSDAKAVSPFLCIIARFWKACILRYRKTVKSRKCDTDPFDTSKLASFAAYISALLLIELVIICWTLSRWQESGK
jgi:hypothetical protein